MLEKERQDRWVFGSKLQAVARRYVGKIRTTSLYLCRLRAAQSAACGHQGSVPVWCLKDKGLPLKALYGLLLLLGEAS